MVQIKALSTPECQEGVPSQGGQRREEHRVVHHDQENIIKDSFKRSVKVDIGGRNKSYDDSVKLKRTEMDPFRLG